MWKPSGISRLPRKFWLAIFIFLAAGTLTIGTLLSQMEAARLPFIDAFAVNNAVVAQWMLSRKYIENWIFWIIGDVISVPLYAYKGWIFTSFQFFVFLIIAILGYLEWRKKLRDLYI